jgi:hypothetical protein
VTASLARFRQTRRRQDLAREFLWTPHIDQRSRLTLDGPLHIVQVRTDVKVFAWSGVLCRRIRRNVLRDLPLVCQPFLPAAIEQTNIGMTIDLELPERPGGEQLLLSP